MLALSRRALECAPLRAQGNYEIQVYGADTVEPKSTMVELHSNFTPDGQKYRSMALSHPPPGARDARDHARSDQLVGSGLLRLYQRQNGHGVQWVGDHIRPRVRVPDSWHWPVGVSLSTEVGYQRAVYSPDTWTWEIRPIIDKYHGPLVLGVQSRAGADLARSGCQPGLGLCSRGVS